MFGAALQQSEELFSAAATVGPASKPLPLFYGLSQAGRAIAAARDSSATWKIRGHGLRVTSNVEQVPAAIITPVPLRHQMDAFSVVSRALDATPLEGKIRLSAVWGAIPELREMHAMRAGSRGCLQISPPDPPSSPLLEMIRPASGSVVFAGELDAEAIGRILAEYSGTERHQIEIGPSLIGDQITQAYLTWPVPPAEELGVRRFRALTDIAVLEGPQWLLIPKLGDPPCPSARLLTWWLLLIALSSIARYEPSLWTSALLVDEQEIAVELEQALEIAQDAVPRLIASALTETRART